MSGASALGTLLTHRLDAVLGTTLASHAHLMRAARSRAVTQAAHISRSRGTPNATEPRPGMDRLAYDADQLAVQQTKAVRHTRQAPYTQHARDSSLHRTRASLLLPSTSTHLSNAARLILALLAQYPERAPAVPGRVPLWSATTLQPALSPALLARALAHNVATSGMFYESHLLELACGKRTPVQLAAEPQTRLHHIAKTRSDAPGDTPLSAQAALLVRQQLDVLAYQAFFWQGLAWPDAAMRWEIHGPPQDATQENPAKPAWMTRLALTLPALGTIHAQLALAGQTLNVHLYAPGCHTLLQAHAAALRLHYARCGLRLAHLSVDNSLVTPGFAP